MKNASVKMVSTSIITALAQISMSVVLEFTCVKAILNASITQEIMHVHLFVKKGSRTSTTLIVAISTSVLPAFTTARLINNASILMEASAVRNDC